MEIPLKDYHSANNIIWLKPAEGDYRIQKYDSKEDVEQIGCKGYATLFRKSFELKEIAAIYSASENLYLRIGAENWCISHPNIKIKFRRLNLCLQNCFEIYEGVQIVFQHKYFFKFIANPINWIDIFTYDEIDEEKDDFFLWVSRITSNKYGFDEIAIEWEKGIRGRNKKELIREIKRLKRKLKVREAEDFDNSDKKLLEYYGRRIDELEKLVSKK